MGPIPFDNLDSASRQGVQCGVECTEQHSKVAEKESIGRSEALCQLGGKAVTFAEPSEVLGSDRFDAVGIDGRDGRKSILFRDEQFAISKSEQHRIASGILRRAVIWDEGKRQ